MRCDKNTKSSNSVTISHDLIDNLSSFHDFFVSNTFFSTFIFEFHFENFYDCAASSPRLLKDELMIKKMFYSKDKNSRRVTKILEVVIFTRWYR